MRLVSARVLGYGRLVDARVNLDSKVIAIVGPNESGKTTFLKALAFLDESRPLTTIERSRSGNVTDKTRVIEVKFVLDEADREVLQDLDLEAMPDTVLVSRVAKGGNARIVVEPKPRKAMRSLEQELTALEKAADRKALLTFVSKESVFGVADMEGARDFHAELVDLNSSLRDLAEGIGENLDENSLALKVGELADALVAESKADSLRAALGGIKSWLERADPLAAVNERLWSRTPDFLLFGESDRTLQSNYALNDKLLASVPPALAHVLRMAELDLDATVAAHRAGDIARRDTALDCANERLRQLFDNTWKQANLSVKLSVDGDLLRVSIVEDGVNVTVFAERSAGLRMFVALVAFLASRNTKTPPVLLIDEAENHLHIDAQADLVSMFISQEQAARVIYTTHSPACLPPDLGVGIRAVVPKEDCQQVSEIKNSFWSNGIGYSPLMLAMGAAAAAFTPARLVVLGEGATEMILLPSLMRSATGLEILPYQVAPGLSEVPKDFYDSLDLEGARVAYLLDSDGGGSCIKDNLIKSGVPQERIVMLPVPGLENVLPDREYADVVRALLVECNGSEVGAMPSLVEPQAASWAAQLKSWAVEQGLAMPSKVAVATRLVELGKAEPASQFDGPLRHVHKQLLAALGVKEQAARGGSESQAQDA